MTGLEPKRPYVLALAVHRDGSGTIEPLASFMTNSAGSAIVNAVGPIRHIVQDGQAAARRYLVIVAGTATKTGDLAQVQVD